MNEIKFRAWHKTEKKMCEVSIINFDKGAFLKGVKKGNDTPYEELGFISRAPENGRFCLFEEIELLQYTGLKDKNGVEIYEGDILNPNSREVIFYDKGLGPMGVGFYTICHNPEYGKGKFTFGQTQSEDSEIIGNIYENPELLTPPPLAD